MEKLQSGPFNPFGNNQNFSLVRECGYELNREATVKCWATASAEQFFPTPVEDINQDRRLSRYLQYGVYETRRKFVNDAIEETYQQINSQDSVPVHSDSVTRTYVLTNTNTSKNLYIAGVGSLIDPYTNPASEPIKSLYEFYYFLASVGQVPIFYNGSSKQSFIVHPGERHINHYCYNFELEGSDFTKQIATRHMNGEIMLHEFIFDFENGNINCSYVEDRQFKNSQIRFKPTGKLYNHNNTYFLG